MITKILHISKYCSNDISDNNNIYQILGIINHTDEFNFGHYITFIKIVCYNEEKIWI